MRGSGALGLALLLCAACGDDTTMMNGPTCSDLCTQYATCFLAANPMFKGSKNALVPCENACYFATDQVRANLRTCSTMDCTTYLACGMAAGLKLMPAPDMAVADGAADAAMADLSAPDLGSTD